MWKNITPTTRQCKQLFAFLIRWILIELSDFPGRERGMINRKEKDHDD